MNSAQQKRGVRTLCALAAAAAAVSLAPAALAAPYASGIAQDGANVSFILNETADTLQVQFDVGGTLNLDPTRGAKAFTLPGGASSFEIVAAKDSGPGYLEGVLLQISEDSNVLNRFFSPRGIVVNTDPSSAYFGLTYVSNSALGTSPSSMTIPDLQPRTTDSGIYVLNADQSDAFGQGDNALNGGLSFITSASSPFRVAIGQDNNLYITDWSDDNGALFRTDGQVQNGELVLADLGGPTNLPPGQNHGSISAVVATGSTAEGNLTIWTIDEDLVPRNSIQRYDIGAGPLPYSAMPSTVASILINNYDDLQRLEDGRLIASQNRFDGTDAGSIFIVSETGEVLWNSLTESRALLEDPAAADLLRQARGISVSADEAFLAVVHNDSSTTLVPLEDGIPDLANLVNLETFPALNFGRDVAFDAAGNLYVVSSAFQALRVFSPGGFTTATTGSDGTFSIVFGDAPTLLPGDANRDGRVDGEDFLIWQAAFGTQEGATWDDGDFNGDGRVDGEDFLIWQAHFGSVASSSAVTPEPAALSLLVLAGAGLMARRRRG